MLPYPLSDHRGGVVVTHLKLLIASYALRMTSNFTIKTNFALLSGYYRLHAYHVMVTSQDFLNCFWMIWINGNQGQLYIGTKYSIIGPNIIENVHGWKFATPQDMWQNSLVLPSRSLNFCQPMKSIEAYKCVYFFLISRLLSYQKKLHITGSCKPI